MGWHGRGSIYTITMVSIFAEYIYLLVAVT
jgi:hypothetical protein